MKKIKGSAFLSSVLVLTTCLLFLKFFTTNIKIKMTNEQLIVKYLEND